MTFYEAALRVLESAGRPLHFLEITEKSIQENLLSHVGKTPEQTMLSRLAAMARRPRERKVIVTAKDTFALVDWALAEDLEALSVTGVVEPNPEEALPPLRPIERHPEPRGENVRAAGRGDRKRRRDEEEDRGKRRKYPPIPEVVFELLSEAQTALKPQELADRARERELGSAELSTEKILTALLEDNQRRIDAGRRPQYLLDAAGLVSLERAGSPSEAPPLELQAAFAAALGIPLEGGRPVLPRGGQTLDGQADATAAQLARASVKDARKATARALRSRLQDLDPLTFEKAVVKLLQGLGFREIKVAKRGKEGPLVTCRRKDGSVELRYAVRIARSTAVDRRLVQELRRDLGHYGAQVGLLTSAGDVRSDARGEAQTNGPLVLLWCGEALAEKFFEAKAAVNVQYVELYELDERFFEQAKLDAEEARQRREERRAERGDAPRPPRPERAELERSRPTFVTAGDDQAVVERSVPQADEEISLERVAVRTERAVSLEVDGEAGEGEDDEGDDDLEAASEFTGARANGEPAPEQVAAPGERKRRRRRRRGRRGRGPRAEGATGAPGEAQASAPGDATESAAPRESSGAAAAPVESATQSAVPLESATQSAAPRDAFAESAAARESSGATAAPLESEHSELTSPPPPPLPPVRGEGQ